MKSDLINIYAGSALRFPVSPLSKGMASPSPLPVEAIDASQLVTGVPIRLSFATIRTISANFAPPCLAPIGLSFTDPDWWEEGNIASDLVERRHPMADSALEREFNERAERWERESGIHSSPGEAILHRDYQTIIGMGEPVIPLLLKRLQSSGDNWFWALLCISGENEDPAKDAHDIDGAVEAWTDWGRKKGYI